ncbi:MAG: hypothetical protein ACFN24_03010 [Candidatus Nanogingivalis sp.]
MQDLKLKKLICLDKSAENNLVSAAPSPTDGKTETVAVQPAPKNIQAPNTGAQNITGIIATILVLALILGLTTLIASKLSKKSKKIILSIFILATATFGGINAFSKLSYAETLVDGKPCQTTGYTDYEVGANVTVGVDLDGSFNKPQLFIKVKGTGDPEKDKTALAAEIDKLKDDKELLKSVVKNFKESNPTSGIVVENFNGEIKQHISKSPKQDEEKQIYQVDAIFTTLTVSPAVPQ